MKSEHAIIMDEVKTAVAVQQEVSTGLRRDLNIVMVDVREVRDAVIRIEKVQSQRPLCDFPNKCVDLEKKLVQFMDAMTARLAAIDLERAESRGGRKILMAIAAGCGSVSGAVVAFIVWLLNHHSGPNLKP